MADQKVSSLVYKFLLSFKFTSVHFHINSKTKTQGNNYNEENKKRYYRILIRNQKLEDLRHLKDQNKLEDLFFLQRRNTTVIVSESRKDTEHFLTRLLEKKIEVISYGQSIVTHMDSLERL